MGNQARVADGATVVSTSPVTSRTVWVLARMSSWLLRTGCCCGADWQTADAGRVPDLVAQVDKTAVDTYRYLNFDQLLSTPKKRTG